ncbi:histone-fold-containing protein [Pisolithus croceorrhizus]|nr:histone-fold-containing protein [Pisolithus croceorrhizus]
MKTKNKQTKFPVARIKKIMQKDEEVGKVAQATPIVISKALELFLTMIVEEACNVTVHRGAKKVEAYHLKHAVETTDMFDFLREIVESVPDPSAGGTIDLDADRGGEGAKRKRGGKTKKNGAASGASSGEPPKRRRKRKPADAESADAGGSKSDVEGDVAMEEDGEGESGKSGRHYRDNDWQDDDDTS